jgi:hypothetical protein
LKCRIITFKQQNRFQKSKERDEISEENCQFYDAIGHLGVRWLDATLFTQWGGPDKLKRRRQAAALQRLRRRPVRTCGRGAQCRLLFVYLRAGGADGAIARVTERKKSSPGRAVDYTNNRDIVPSPLPGLPLLLLFNPGVAHCSAALHHRLLFLRRLRR